MLLMSKAAPLPPLLTSKAAPLPLPTILAISNHAGTQVNLSAGTLSVGFINTSLNPSLFLGNGVTTGMDGRNAENREIRFDGGKRG